MIDTLKASSHAEKAHAHILDQLMRQKLNLGEWLDRRALAAELGVSLAPVNDAIIQLEAEGLLETVPRRGTRVRVAKAEELRGQLVLREALECAAARLYCGQPVRERRKPLRALAAQVEGAHLLSVEFKRGELALHRALIELADCPALTLAFERVAKMSFFLAVEELMAALPPQPHDNHLTLIDDLCAASPAQAEVRMRRHIRTGKEPLFERTWGRLLGR